MSKLVNRHGAYLDDVEREEGARYYVERAKNQRGGHDYIKVWTRGAAVRRAYCPGSHASGTWPAAATAISGLVSSLSGMDLAAAFLSNRCRRVNPQDMPAEWRRALIPLSYELTAACLGAMWGPESRRHPAPWNIEAHFEEVNGERVIATR